MNQCVYQIPPLTSFGRDDKNEDCRSRLWLLRNDFMKACLLVLGIITRIPEKLKRYQPQKGDTLIEIIALDAHKRYSQVCVQNKKGKFLCEKQWVLSADIWQRRVFGY